MAEVANVADGTIYLYFRNKRKLLMTVINTAFDAFMSRARTELEALNAPGDKLRRLAQLHLESFQANRNLDVVFQMENVGRAQHFLAPLSHDHMVEYFGLVRAAIREGQEQGLFRAELREKVAANCFFGALDEMVTSWVLDETNYRLADVANPVTDILLRGFAKN